MENEQYYLFVDKTGECFEAFQKTGNLENGELDYNNLVGAWLRSGRKFTVGDMMSFKQDLEDAGFKWCIDFYVKKVKKAEKD